MKYSSIILLCILVASSSSSPVTTWTIRINESEGSQNCVAKTRTQFFFGTKICQAQFSCNQNNYVHSGIGISISEKVAIQEAINDSRNQCGRSTGCIRYQIIDRIESQLNFMN